MAVMDLGAALAKGMPKKPMAPGPEPAEEELELVMSDLIAALKKGDARAAAQAFRAGHEVCASYAGDEPEV